MPPEVVKSSPQIQFGVFTVDVRAGELRKQGLRIKLQERPFQLLLALIERPGEVLTRDELRQRLWGDGTYVDFDHSISSAVNKLRAALNDSASHPRYVETVGRRGYRFLADVKRSAQPSRQPQVAAESEVGGAGQKHWFALAAIVFLAFGLAAAAYFFWARRSSQRARPARALVAVLPFDNLTGDPEQAYLSDGLTEEMITQLGRLDPAGLGVVALRTSVMHLQQNPEELERTAQQLGAQYLLGGSVRRGTDRLRIAVHLIRMQDQTQLWAQEYDRTPRDLLQVQAEIAQQVTSEIDTTLGHSERAYSATAPAAQSEQQYEAYDLYLRGRYFWNKRSAEGFKQAESNFEQAIRGDPTYARAYAGLADTYALIATYDLGPDAEFIPKARAAALKALELDPNLAEAHTSLALIAEMYDWDWTRAESEFRRALELEPNYATAHQWYGEFLGFQGRFEDGLAESEKARQLDPLSLIIAADRCATLFFARRYQPAIEQCKTVHEMEPTFGRAYLMVDAYVRTGQRAEALKIIQEFRQRQPVDPWSQGWSLVWEIETYAHFGEKVSAAAALRKLEKIAPPGEEGSAPKLARAYAALGDSDKAIRILQQEYDRRSTTLIGLKVDPGWDPIRSDPRFQNLLRKMSFSQ